MNLVALSGASNVLSVVLKIPSRGKSGKSNGEETSPVAVPTATEKKLALPVPHSSSMDIAVSPLVTDGASSSLCEMKGLRLIDLDDPLASVTRRLVVMSVDQG